MVSAVVSIAHRHEQIKEKSEPSYPRQNIGMVFGIRSTASPEGIREKSLTIQRDSTQGYEMKLRSSVYPF